MTDAYINICVNKAQIFLFMFFLFFFRRCVGGEGARFCVIMCNCRVYKKTFIHQSAIIYYAHTATQMGGKSEIIHAIQQQIRVLFTFIERVHVSVCPFVLGHFPCISFCCCRASYEKTTIPVPETRTCDQNTACAHPSTLNALQPM